MSNDASPQEDKDKILFTLPKGTVIHYYGAHCELQQDTIITSEDIANVGSLQDYHKLLHKHGADNGDFTKIAEREGWEVLRRQRRALNWNIK